MEIVSRPDIRSADEAKAYVTKLRTILRYLGTCDGDMEKGSLRADVNVSVRRPGEPLGTRCEIKNVNSIRFIGQAVDAEARRQIGVIEDGGAIQQETRLFDPGRGETRSMRSKEEAHDYRYFPDPDLLPLEFDQAYVDALAAELPELPDAKKARFVSDYGLSPYDATVLVAERDLAAYYERAVAAEPAGRDAKLVANWVTGDIAAYANSVGLPVYATQVTPEQVAGLVDLIVDGTISGKIAKDVLALMVGEETGADPAGHRGAARPAPGDRHGRHRGRHRRHHGGQPRQGRPGAGQAQHARLVRRPGHEGHGRQGQPAGRQRGAEEQARDLKACPPARAGKGRDAERRRMPALGPANLVGLPLSAGRGSCGKIPSTCPQPCRRASCCSTDGRTRSCAHARRRCGSRNRRPGPGRHCAGPRPEPAHAPPGPRREPVPRRRRLR